MKKFIYFLFVYMFFSFNVAYAESTSTYFIESKKIFPIESTVNIICIKNVQYVIVRQLRPQATVPMSISVLYDTNGRLLYCKSTEVPNE